MEEIIKELEQFLKNLNTQINQELFSRVQAKAGAEVREEMRRRVIMGQEAGEGTRGEIAEKLIVELKQNPDKFIKLDDDKKNRLSAECYDEMDKEKPEVQKNKKLLENLIEYLNMDDDQLYLELDQLSKIFQYYNFHVNTQIAIFCHLMRINHKMDLGPDEKTYLPDPDAMINHEYKYIDVKDVLRMFKEKGFDAFFSDTDPKTEKAREEVAKRFDETKRDFTSRQLASNILGTIFEKDVVDITDEDYETIIEKMDELFFGHISHRLVKKIKKQKELELNPPVEKVENTENETEANDTSKNTESIVKIAIAKKQTSLNQTIREINKFFDLDTLELKESLSLDQIIYILSLMYSINMEKQKVEAFLRSAMREFKKLHPYAIYNQGYDKFARLSNKFSEIQEHLDMIEYILSDATIFMCTDSEYASTKELVEEEISEIMRLINGDYTYEIEEAKKLLKSSEE